MTNADTACHTLPAASTAVLVIDVQQGLCEGPWAAHEPLPMIGRINGLLERARAAGAAVVMIQHASPDGVLALGSRGWALADGLAVAPGDLPLHKTATDSFHRTGLHKTLAARGVAQLVICGLQSDYCVDTTTRRALALGYPVTLVADGHSTCANPVLDAAHIIAHHTHTLAAIESFGVRAVPAAAADIVFSTS